MLDTVRLRSPFIAADLARQIERRLVKRYAVELSTGDLLWELTSGSLEGSYDSRISVQVNTKEYQVVRYQKDGSMQVRTILVDCEPYIIVEASVHKAMLGHNVTGGPINFQPAIHWFIDKLSSILSTPLPAASLWGVEKIDWSECYTLPHAGIVDFITTLNSARYPRRKVSRFSSESIFAPGTTTAVKIYHKGPEFQKHDRKRIIDFLGRKKAADLQTLANGIMRVEVSIKSKKLRADFGLKPVVSDITDDYLNQVHDHEVEKLLREGKSDMDIVRNHVEVKRRLFDTYSPSIASTLYGVWAQFSTVGEAEVRRDLPKATFYKYRKLLTDAGCTWFGTDIVLRTTAIPEGFTLSRSDSHRIVTEDPLVEKLLLSYRATFAA